MSSVDNVGVSRECTNSASHSQYVGIAYTIGYAIFILFVSLYSWVIILTHSRYAALNCCQKLAQWFIELHRKRQCYIALIAHIFDQATDISVLLSWYQLAVKEEKHEIECEGINMTYSFYLGVFIIIQYRTISSIFIFVYTKSVRSAFFQFLDLEIFRAIMINWKLQSKEPSNPQRWIQSWEAAFESAPQSLLQFVFLMKTGSFTNNGIVVISFIFSVFSMISRCITDDIVIFTESARYAYSSPNDAIDKASISQKSVIERVASNIHVYGIHEQDTMNTIEIDNNQPSQNNIFKAGNASASNRRSWIPHSGYLSRLAFRFMDISLRLMICALLWVVVGGFFLVSFLFLEFVVLLAVSIKLKAYDIIHGMIAVPICRINQQTKTFSEAFFWYRSIGHFVILLLVTAFVFIEEIECVFCVEYEERITWSVSNTLMSFVFAYCWLMAFAYPVLWIYISLIRRWVRDEGSKGRTIEDMYASEDLQGLIEMMEFGYKTSSKSVKKSRKKFKREKQRKRIGLKRVKPRGKTKSVDINEPEPELQHEEEEKYEVLAQEESKSAALPFDADRTTTVSGSASEFGGVGAETNESAYFGLSADEICNALLLEDLAAIKDWRRMNCALILPLIELKVDFKNIRNKYHNVVHQLCQRTDDVSYEVRKILQHSVSIDLNEQDKDKEMSALHFACVHARNIHIINVLCSYPQPKTLDNYRRLRRSQQPLPIDVNLADYKNRTALHLAAQHNTLQCFRTLLNVKGCNVNCLDNEGSTIFHYAARSDNYEVMQFILQNQVLHDLKESDLANNFGVRPSHLLSQFGSVESMKLAQEFGIGFDAFDWNYNHCVFYAAQSGNLPVFRRLLSMDFNISSNIGKMQNKKQRTALHAVCRCSDAKRWSDCYQIGLLLIEDHLLDPNVRDVNGSTALHYACQYSSAKIVDLLIANGADIELRDKQHELAVQVLRLRTIHADKKEIRHIFDTIYNKYDGNVQRHLNQHRKGDRTLANLQNVKSLFSENKDVVIKMNGNEQK